MNCLEMLSVPQSRIFAVIGLRTELVGAEFSKRHELIVRGTRTVIITERLDWTH